jgi:hypothetical protein
MLDTRYWMEDRNSEPTELHLLRVQHRVSSIQYRVSLLEENRTDNLLIDGNKLQRESVK